MIAAFVTLIELVLNLIVEVAKKLLGLALLAFLVVASVITLIVLVLIQVLT
jgi:hypothetical protein